MQSSPSAVRPGAQPSEAAAAEGADRQRRPRGRLSIAALVALVALVTGAVNLAFQLRPELKRDPGVEHWADMAVVAIDKNVPYADYLKRPGASREAEVSGATVGNVVYLRTEMHGFKGQAARLRWFTYDEENGQRLPAPFSTGLTFKGRAPTAKSVAEQWVPMPRRSGTFVIRFQLYDSDDRLLAVAEGPKFTSFALPTDHG